MRGRQGFTLIEVLGAMVIFTSGVLMVLGLSETLQRQLSRSGIITEMSSVIGAQIDSLEAIEYDSLATGQTSASVSFQNRNFTLSRNVTQYSPLVKEVTVTLSANGWDGPTRSQSSYVVDEW